MSEFDLTTTHVPRKANIIADALSCCAYLDPAKVAAVYVIVESDLFAAIRLAQEWDSSDTFRDLTFCTLASDRGLCMHDILVCHTLFTGGQTIVIFDDKELQYHILALHYDARLGGHLGPYHMIGSFSTRYY